MKSELITFSPLSFFLSHSTPYEMSLGQFAKRNPFLSDLATRNSINNSIQVHFQRPLMSPSNLNSSVTIINPPVKAVPSLIPSPTQE